MAGQMAAVAAMVCVGLRGATAAPAPAATPLKVTPWGNVLVTFAYLDQGDPVGLPADPVHMPEIISILRRLGVDATLPVHSRPEDLPEDRTYWNMLWTQEAPGLVVPYVVPPAGAQACLPAGRADPTAWAERLLDSLAPLWKDRLVEVGQRRLLGWPTQAPGPDFVPLLARRGWTPLIGPGGRGAFLPVRVGRPGYRALAEDSTTRHQPQVEALLFLDAPLPVVGALEDPGWMNRLVASVFGSVSRWRAIHIRGFEGGGEGEWSRYQNRLKYFPAWLESLAWWQAFMETQFWLLEDALTPEAPIALYTSDDDSLTGLGRQVADRASIAFMTRLGWPDSLLGLDPLGEAGYPAHRLSEEQILAGELKSYKLLIVAARRVPPPVLAQISEFAAAGNYLLAYHNSFLDEPDGPGSVAFGRLFECRPAALLEAGRSPDAKPLLLRLHGADQDDAGLPLKAALRKAGPVTDTRVRTVDPQGARVLATVHDRAAVTVTADGRRVFFGLQQASRRTFVPAVLPAMAEQAGLQPAVSYRILSTPAAEAQVQIGYLDNARLKGRLVVVINHGGRVRVRLSAGVPQEGVTAWELVENRLLEENSDGVVDLEIPAGQVRLVLMIAPLLAKRAASKQAGLADRARLFPFHCSRHFFVRKARVHPWDDAPFLAQPGTANAVIVLGDKAGQEDRRLADRLRTTIARWPLAANRVELPIVTASQLRPEDARTKNLFCFGGPAENAVVAAAVAAGRLRDDPAGAILSAHEHPWYAGGNLVAIVGPPARRTELYRQFHGWMRVWMDSTTAYEPGPWEHEPSTGRLKKLDRQVHRDRTGVRVTWTLQLVDGSQLNAWPERAAGRLRLAPPSGPVITLEPTAGPASRHADPVLQGRASGEGGRPVTVQLDWFNASRFDRFWERIDAPNGPWLAQAKLVTGERLGLRLRLNNPSALPPETTIRLEVSFDGIPFEDTCALSPATREP